MLPVFYLEGLKFQKRENICDFNHRGCYASRFLTIELNFKKGTNFTELLRRGC